MSDLVTSVRTGFDALAVDADLRAGALAAVDRWLTEPAFSAYVSPIEGLVEQGSFAELFDAFWQVLPFGTGGRRGPVGVGTNRFNPWTLGTSVQGHAELLRESHPGEDVSVVIAFDVREFRDRRGVYDRGRPNPLLGLTSRELARQAACVYVANGVKVLLPDPDGDVLLATPELSLTIRRLGAHGGLNVSASHNHPDDNGGKVYNHHGGQDVPPQDEILARRVESVAAPRTVPWEEARAEGRIEFLDPAERSHYRSVVRRLALAPEHRAGPIVFTNLHGVGLGSILPVLEEEGFDVHTVPSQASLDGGFPGVAHLAPNPEVTTCYAPGEAVADDCGAELILATDPDADRIGAEVRDADGRWHFLPGNELLCLALRFTLSRRREQARLPADAYMLTTVVTTRLLGTIARSYGCAVADDLCVGFKYMADVIARLETTGSWRHLRAGAESLVFAGEEAHGLMLTPAIREKDGAAAALVLAELHAVCRAEGRTLLDELDAIHARFGYVANRLVNTVMTGSTGRQRMTSIQDSLRKQPPGEVDGRPVTAMHDLADPRGWRGPLLSSTDFANRNVLVFEFGGGRRLVVRPSGTEPKNKVYVEVPGLTPSEDLTADELLEERRRCDAEAEALGRAFQRLMLARVGLDLPVYAQDLSPLLPLDRRLDFAHRDLPEVERRAVAGVELGPWVSEHVGDREQVDLFAPGVAAWLGGAGLPAAADAAVRRAFHLSSET